MLDAGALMPHDDAGAVMYPGALVRAIAAPMVMVMMVRVMMVMMVMVMVMGDGNGPVRTASVAGHMPFSGFLHRDACWC